MIQLRRGLESNLSNIVLESGQLGWAEDTHTLKVGDGATRYSNLTSLSPLPGYLSSTGIDGTEIDSFSIKLGESSSVFEGKLYLYDDTIESLAYLDSIGPMNLKCSSLYVGLPDDGITCTIKNVSTPIDNTDAANKSYVDSRTNEYGIECGTSGIWTYRKWNSGITECWGRIRATYYDVNTLRGTSNLPFTFSGNIAANVTKIGGTASFDTLYANTSYTYTTTTFTAILCNSGHQFASGDALDLSVHLLGASA